MMKNQRILLSACAATLLLISGRAFADDAKCRDAFDKALRNVGNQEQKANRKCIKDNLTGDATSCVDGISAKAADKETKVTDLFLPGGKCATLPAFGVNSGGSPAGDDANKDAEKGTDDILRDLWGNPVNGITTGDKCADATAKRTGKIYDTILKAFRGCVKTPVADLTAETACVGTAIGDAKVATFAGKLDSDVNNKCTNPIPDGTDDGKCGGELSQSAFATCAVNVAKCDACLAINSMTGTTADCDTLDDGSVNGSCGTSCPCGLTAGSYTLTQNAGGFLSSYTFAPYAFPAGGTILEDVGAPDVNCVHDVVVPFPGGFSSPNFCVPALGLSVSVTQTGCGIGKIDSNGGSDFDTNEVADTSDSLGGPPVCNLPHAGCTNGGDASTRVDVTVGNGSADGCGCGQADALVTVPVHTVSWADTSGGAPACAPCPGNCIQDVELPTAAFNQILDFTTATAAGHWADIDGDGCTVAGPAAPTGGYPVGQCYGDNAPCTLATQAVDCALDTPATCRGVGTCIDLSVLNTPATAVNTVAQGQFGATGGLFDGSFTVSLPNQMSGPGAPLGATCGSPPTINYSGLATRCIP